MARRSKRAAEAGTAVGYVRTSTDEQANSGLGLAAQRAAIAQECEVRDWRLVDTYEDPAASGKTMSGRPGLAAALEAVETGQAATLVVAKLDRLSRSVHDFSGLLLRAERAGWSLVLLDLGVDTTSVMGEAMANMVANFAQAERRRIGERTKDALAQRRAQGVHLGRPVTLPKQVAVRIVREHRRGASWSAIARDLNDDDIPTAQGGGSWWPATVRGIYFRVTGEQPAA